MALGPQVRPLPRLLRQKAQAPATADLFGPAPVDEAKPARPESALRTDSANPAAYLEALDFGAPTSVPLAPAAAPPAGALPVRSAPALRPDQPVSARPPAISREPGPGPARTGLAGLAQVRPEERDEEGDMFPPTLPQAPPLAPGQEQLSCSVVKPIFKSNDNAFQVLIIKVGSEEKRCSIRNAHGAFLKGDRLTLKGKWGAYKGQETFEATSAVPEVPKGAKGIAAWIKAGKVKGVGQGTARRIIEAYGEDAESKIADFDALVAIGIPADKAERIVEAWVANAGQAELFAHLAKHGLGDALIGKVVRRYGAAASRIIEQNPWKLSEDIDGIGFETADKVAMAAGRQKTDPQRYRAALRAAIDQATAQEGHTGLPKQTAVEAGMKLLGFYATNRNGVASELEAICDGMLHVYDEDTSLVHPVALRAAERDLAARLIAMRAENKADPIPLDSARNAIAQACADLKVSLDPAQATAAVTALHDGISVITGGPGTGKTTTQRVVVRALQKLGKSVALAAPTGRAAKRLADVSGENASTLHRLLQFSTELGGFTYNEHNPLPEDWSVIDESSMIGTKLAQAFFCALKPGSGATIVGDIDQLPSVDSGQVLRDLMNSGLISVSRLNVVHRQGADSGIVTAAHRINSGKFPVEEGEQLDGFSVDVHYSYDEFIPRVIELITKEMPARGYDPLRDVQVLAPMRRGDLGVSKLNDAIKAAINPARDDGRTEKFGVKTFSVGDRVMQMKNDYIKGVFNGEVGFVVDVGRDIEEDGSFTPFMRVDYSGYSVRYRGKEVAEVEQAWACTVHKSQGCEFPAVIFVCPMSAKIMLMRNLAYTAITRAKKECVVIDDGRGLQQAVDNIDKSKRMTGLCTRIKDACVNELPAPAPR